nr:hypothetical protein [Polymorphobacter sp.]
MQPRRAQQPITIRSDRAAARLAVLTRDGRSQAQVIEEALDAMPAPEAIAENPERAALLARIDATIAKLSQRKIPSMAEFDAKEYDERGNLR